MLLYHPTHEFSTIRNADKITELLGDTVAYLSYLVVIR